MATHANNGHVTWTALISTVLGVCGLSATIAGGVGAYVLGQHQASPHDGAWTDREQKQFTDGLTVRLSSIESNQSRMDDKLDTLLERVHAPQ